MGPSNLSPLAIPVELEKTVQMYEKFYAKQFSGRKLTWLYHLSHGDIKMGYLPKQYIITMTTFQVKITEKNCFDIKLCISFFFNFSDGNSTSF